MTCQSKRRLRQLFNRGKKKRRNKEDSQAQVHLLSSSTTTNAKFGARNVRSTPSKRHLKSDGSSSAQLHALLEEVAASSTSSTVSKRRLANRMKTIERSPRQTTRVGENTIANDIPRTIIKDGKDSKRSLQSDESSGRRLENILEKLVQDVVIDATPQKKQNSDYNCETPRLEAMQETPKRKAPLTPSSANYTSLGDLIKKDTPSPRHRFEMDDHDQQSKIYLQSRKHRGKKTKNQPTAAAAATIERSRVMMKNCGMVKQLEVSPGSATISISSCSMDSLLDDPDRLEKYRLLNLPPPSPPPRRNLNKASLKKASFESSWADDIKKSLVESYGKATSMFGCSSGLFI